MLETQLLNKTIHDRKAFDCGVPHLNDFLAKSASSAAERSLSKTFVLVDTDNPSEILAYYTLGYITVNAPQNSKLRSYPHPIPAVKLARMAIAVKLQGQSFGEQLLVEVIIKTANTTTIDNPGAVCGLFVDAKEGVEAFYLKYGFISAEAKDAQQLWMPIDNCIEIAKASY